MIKPEATNRTRFNNRFGLKPWLTLLSEIELQLPDLCQAGSWPGYAKVICWGFITLLCLLIGYWVYIAPQLRLLHGAIEEEQHLLHRYRENIQQYADLPIYQQQRPQIQQQIQHLLRQLPADRSAPELVEQIGEQARIYQVQLQELKLQPEKPHEQYIMQPMLITASGHYHHLVRFIAGLTQMERIVTLHDFTLVPVQHQLRLSLKAVAYYVPTSLPKETGT